MSTVSHFRLPNFEHIDLDVCHHLREFSAPPNSAAPSVCSGPAEPNDYQNCYHPFKSIARDGEFQRFKETRVLPRLNPPKNNGKYQGQVCVRSPCQIAPQSLEFITRSIADPLWNSTFCLERIKTLVTSPELGDTTLRIEEIWILYCKKSPYGVLLRDVYELSKIIRYLDLNFSKPDFAREFILKIFEHLKKGVRVRRMSENNLYDELRLTFDSFARILKFGQATIRLSVLQLLDAWLKLFKKSCDACEGESYCASCDTVQTKKKCAKKEWKVTEENRYYQQEVPCEKFKNHLVLPEITRKCVAGCEVSSQKPAEISEAMLSRSSFFGALESSILPSILEQLISSGEIDEQYVLELIIMRRMCENSYCIRSCVMNSSIIDAILLKLGYPDADQLVLCRTVELLYSILVSQDDENGAKMYTVPSEESFTVLLLRFMNLMICNEKTRVNPIRNDLAFIIYLLPRYCAPLCKAFSKHVRDFSAILSNNILTDQSFEVVLDSTPEDLELIQYFIWILDLVIPAQSNYYQVIESYQLVPVLVRLLVGPCALIEEAGPGSACVENVMIAAWKALISFAKIQPLSFLHPEGVLTMLNTLSIFGTTGDKISLLVVEAFLDVLRTILLTSNNNSTPDDQAEELYSQIIPHFAKRNAMEVFCSCLKRLTREPFSVSLESILCKVLQCCAEMGKYDESLKVEFANKKGVKAVIKLLHLLLYTPAQVRHMNPMLHIMVADTIWNCIADCPTGLEIFLLYEGVFRILDLLEIAASPTAKLHILGTIIDLCDYSRCADQMMFWRRQQLRCRMARLAHTSDFKLARSHLTIGTRNHGALLGNEIGEAVEDNDSSLPALFCQLWRDEEGRFGVIRDEDGIIASLEYPTMSQYGREYRRKIIQGRPLAPNTPGPSCLDLIGSLRPRIYLLIKTITEGTNTEASVFSGLSLKNQITMTVILNYLDLKRSEIWLELEKELKAEGLKLVDSDQTGMECMLKICRNKIAVTVNTQRYLIQRHREQAAMNERELYNLIRNCQIQDHLMALREAQYYATLSDYYLLLDKRLWHSSRLNDLFMRTEDMSLIKPSTRKSPPELDLYPYDQQSRRSTSLDQLGQFGISLEVDPTMANMIPEEPDSRARLPSQYGSPLSLTFSPEGSHYQVSPAVLFKALSKVIAQHKQWAGKGIDEEREWLMRKKWNVDWYPKAKEHL